MRYVIHLRLTKLRSPWGRNLVHNVASISETLQEPMFYGPIDGSEKPFVLLAQANPGTQTPGGGGAGPSLPPAPTTVADKTGVLVSGTDGSIKSSIASALQQSDFARFETYPPHESSYWKNSVRSDSPLPKIHSNHKKSF